MNASTWLGSTCSIGSSWSRSKPAISTKTLSRAALASRTRLIQRQQPRLHRFVEPFEALGIYPDSADTFTKAHTEPKECPCVLHEFRLLMFLTRVSLATLNLGL